jgi:hypothetical protein
VRKVQDRQGQEQTDDKAAAEHLGGVSGVLIVRGVRCAVVSYVCVVSFMHRIPPVGP